MFGQTPPPQAPPPMSMNDPNAWLRRIDQTTTMTYHWVRAGVIASIVLLILILIGF